jgi:hypothetical protein
MDSVAVLSMCSWIMSELARVLHGLTVGEAQNVVDALTEVRIPIIWSDGGGVKRVLRPELKLQDQLLLLIATSMPDVTSGELIAWAEYKDTKYVMKVIRGLHAKRFVEFTEKTEKVRILPPGANFVQELIRKKNLSDIR